MTPGEYFAWWVAAEAALVAVLWMTAFAVLVFSPRVTR